VHGVGCKVKEKRCPRPKARKLGGWQKALKLHSLPAAGKNGSISATLVIYWEFT
jgi:hypothetical protein